MGFRFQGLGFRVYRVLGELLVSLLSWRARKGSPGHVSWHASYSLRLSRGLYRVGGYIGFRISGLGLRV